MVALTQPEGEDIMQTVNIATKDSDIEVIYGNSRSPYEEPRREAFGHLKYLYSDISDIRQYYIRLGFHLEEFRNSRYYEDFHYPDFYEFCDVNLGMDKGAVSRCINVYKQFNASNDVRVTAGCKTIGCAMDLSERWKDYSYTQLCEMLPLSEHERESITPDMTVKQIREFKKNLRESERSMEEAFDFLDGVIKEMKDKPVASTQQKEKKRFDKDKYDCTRGIVRQNTVRNCDAIDENVIFNVFDKNGKFLGGNVWCELIYKSKNEYYFRLRQAYDEDGKMIL